jgi:hypothetical protein
MCRRLSRLILGLFALLQGIAPLLHAHVMPPAGGQTGLHVHTVVIAPAGDSGLTASLTIAGEPESAAITAPAEHRRDEALGRVMQPAVAHVPPVAAIEAGRLPVDGRVPGSHPLATALRLPFAQGPPASTHSA